MKTLLKYLALGLIGNICAFILAIINSVFIEKRLNLSFYFGDIGVYFAVVLLAFITCIIFLSPCLLLTDILLKRLKWRYLIVGTGAGCVFGLWVMSKVSSDLSGNQWYFILLKIFGFSSLGFIGGIMLTLTTHWLDRLDNK